MHRDKRECATCAFFHKGGSTSLWGQCRRYAPRPRIYDSDSEAEDAKGRHYAEWPWVDSEEFCGEWAAR